MKTKEKYFELLLAITSNTEFSEQIAADLIVSQKDSELFYNKHSEKHFSNRGINDSNNEELSIVYLLDKLEEHEYGYELDYKADAEDLNTALILLSKGKIKDELFTEDDEEDSNGMFEMLMDADDALEEFDLSIVEFPLESDSHPIVLVPRDKAEEVEVLIDELFG